MKLKSKKLVKYQNNIPVYDITVNDENIHQFTLSNTCIVHNCTNALSDRFVILSKITENNYNKSIEAVKSKWESNPNEENFYVLEYAEGYKKLESALSKQEIESKYGFTFPNGMSTITAFVPSPSIWKSTVASYNKKSLSYVQAILSKFKHKDCEIDIDGNKVDFNNITYPYEFIKEFSMPGYRKDDEGNIIPRTAQFLVSFDVDKDLSVCEESGSINSLIVNRGIHINWVKEAYQKALKQYYELIHDYAWCGLKINVICLSPEVDFSSQTKERCVKIDDLTKDEVLPGLIYEFKQVFKNNKDYFDNHIVRLNEYAASLNKISAINKVKAAIGTVDGGNRVRAKIPANVRDAASNDRIKCNLFICEGKSAASTLIKARNPLYDAVLPLRGIPLNSVSADLDTIMNNEEMKGMVISIGYGTNEYNNLDSCRYGKIILAADSDADGGKISSMIAGFIAKKMTGLLDDGRVYVALAPLYAQGGTYVYPGEDYTKILDLNKPFKRFKGLGEININEAKDFFFNDNRKLIQLTSNNLEYVFSLLTSSTERKDLMSAGNIVIDKYNLGIL